MYLGNDLIESVPVEIESLSQPGYLGKFKRGLKEKYWDLIQNSPAKPEFLVAHMNTERLPDNKGIQPAA